MSARRLGPAIVLVSGLLAGCAAARRTVQVQAPAALARSRALAFAKAVNLKPGELPGFEVLGTETERPPPGPIGLAQDRCTGILSPSVRVARVSSAEFSAGRGRHSVLLKSAVGVWPAPGDVVFNSVASETPRGEECLVAALRAAHRKINLEREGRRRIGPFTVATVPYPLPGVSRGSLMKIDETRLRRSGAVFFHVYRDVFDFVTGPSNVELEAVGLGNPVPSQTVQPVLRSLLARARASAGALGSRTSSS